MEQHSELHDTKSRGGRPWSFDREAAVEAAMLLFWRHSYEGVSIADLTKAIGVAPPSLYAAFGNKAGLYQQVLDHYTETFGTLDVDAIGSAASLTEAVRMLLNGAIWTVSHRQHERGCMISSGLVACHPDHAAIAQDAAVRRAALREQIVQAISPYVGDAAVQPLARHLAAVMQGISIQARDGATAEELRELADDVVAGVEARFPVPEGATMREQGEVSDRCASSIDRRIA